MNRLFDLLKRFWRSGRGKIATAVLIVALASGGVVWGVRYYQNNPEKILSDAISQLSEAKSTGFQGSYRTSTTDATQHTQENFNLTFNGDTSQNAMQTYLEAKAGNLTLKARVQNDQKATYLKLENLSALTGQALSQPQYALFTAQLKAIAGKLEGKWLKIDSQSNDILGTLPCSKLLGSGTIDDSARAKIGTLLRNHRFVTIPQTFANETINGHESVHFRLQLNPAKAKEFMTQLQEIEPFKSSKGCLQPTLSEAGDTLLHKLAQSSIDFWADARTHSPTKLGVTMADGQKTTSFTLALELNNQTTITAPGTDVVEFKDLLTTIKPGT